MRRRYLSNLSNPNLYHYAKFIKFNCRRRYSILSELKGKEFRVLDKGFVRLIDCMPSYVDPELGLDKAITDAARISYSYPEDQRTKKDSDKNLINFLIRHAHTSPFEMIEFKFHVKMPIFIWRQWIRHRMASVNEISGRYTKLKAEFYKPGRLMGQSKNNRQCSSGEITDPEIVKYFNDLCDNPKGFEAYLHFLDSGVSRELSRIHLPLNIYTEAYWKINLHNLYRFLRLRMTNDAQQEIRDYATSIYENIVKPLCPVSSRAFEKYVSNAVTLSELDIKIMQRYGFNAPSLKETMKVAPEMSKREYNEFIDKLKKIVSV